MPLPLRARAVIAVVTASALGLVGLLGTRYADAGFGRLGTLALLSALVLTAWSRPLIVYRGHASEAVHADEGLLLVALLLLPPRGVLLALAVAAAVGQVVHRRGLVKAAFNWAEVMVAASLAVLVTRALGIDLTGDASVPDLGIAL